MIDLHCHILAGLDDGAADLETSLAMAEIAVADGIETIVATPHVGVGGGRRPQMFFPYATTSVRTEAGGATVPEIVRAATAELNEALIERGLALTILPGMEVEAHPEVAWLVRQGEFLALGDQGKYLLLEVPLAGIPTYLEQLCFELQIAGITPILAHPERSELLRQEPGVCERLVERGCLMQVNADSVRGRQGRTVRNIATDLIREGLAHILSTDAHNASSRPPRLSDARDAVVQIADEDTFLRMTEVVPRAVLVGGERKSP